MSDTDDTDCLLLIPPDFFSVYSDTEEPANVPYFTVVDSLISQVNSLENRINRIESTSDIESLNSTLQSPLRTVASRSISMPQFSKSSSLEDVQLQKDNNLESNQSTPQRPRSKFKQRSLPSTPITTKQFSRYVPKRTTNRVARNLYAGPQDQFMQYGQDMGDYDDRIHNNYSADPRSNDSFLSEPDSSKYNLELKEIDNMLMEVANKFKKNQSRLQRNEEMLAKSKQDNELCRKERTWQPGETKGSVPDLGMGMRDLMYPQEELNILKPKIGTDTHYKKSVQPAQQYCTSEAPIESNFADDSTSSSDSAPITIYQRSTDHKTEANVQHPIQVLHEHRNLKMNKLNDDERLFDEKNRPRSPFTASTNMNSFCPVNNRLALMSLTDLWNNPKKSPDSKNFNSKLEEERLRRQHCEQLILELQARNLEFQQRLAVATKVDLAKDQAIMKLQAISESAVGQVEVLENKNEAQSREIKKLKALLISEKEETTKKITHYENEASKALNLAHTSQEKLAALEKRANEYSKMITSLEDQLKTIEIDYKSEMDQNRQLSSILSKKEMELNETKKFLADARTEMVQDIKPLQTELSSLKSEHGKLQQQLIERTSAFKKLELEKKKLLNDIESYKKTEKTLQDELNKQKETLEGNKAVLRNFYQDQVEIVVRDKLKEFQVQLEKEQALMQEELLTRETNIAKNAANYMQQLNEKHTLEVELLEAKHKEEIKLSQLQLKHAYQQIDALTIKYQQQQTKRANIVQQLHKVMEAQWLEALKIINNGRTPMPQHDNSSITMNDQLNSLKSKSYINVEEILLNDDVKSQKSKAAKPADSSCSFENSFENCMNFDHHSDSIRTPRSRKNPEEVQKEVDQFVQMLLNKSPRESNFKSQHSSGDQHESNSFDSFPKENPDGTKQKSVKFASKRPWK